MKRCELLVPAGGPKQFIAAVENGADAVYVGGKLFNARVNAENFDDKELEQAIDYGHVRGVKTYITMNTLLRDEDLPYAFRQASHLWKIGADGIIIQDLGLGKLIKEHLPGIAIHLSTQGSVYDAEGVKAAAKLGYERVVLARELTLEEIKKAVETGIEIEVFVHGALCICYSGQCQLSRFIGGRSGNKGGCAQPCRLPYKGVQGQPYPLSPKDLCLIEEVGKLAEVGVTSLKIEGRMKSPEYVAVVTSIYRKYLDLWYTNGAYEVEEEDLNMLRQIFNRGGFTKGYFYGDPNNNLMSSDFPKNAGLYLGKVLKDSKGPIMEISSGREVVKGDYIEVRSQEPTANLVTYVDKLKNHTFCVGDIKKPVSKGDEVYRLASGELMLKARKTFENIDFNRGKYLRKIPVTMKAIINPGKPLSLQVNYKSFYGNSIRISCEGQSPQCAQGGKGCAENVKKQLCKTGGTPFEVVAVDVKEISKAFVSTSEINAVRRQALQKLEKAIKHSYKRLSESHDYIIDSDKREVSTNNTRSSFPKVELFFYSEEEFRNCNVKALIHKCKEVLNPLVEVCVLVPLEAYFKITEDIKLIPYIQNINTGLWDEEISEHFQEITEKLKERQSAVYVGNLKCIEPFVKAGVKVYGDVGLNITNEQAKKAYEFLGVKKALSSLENWEKGFGAYPLMISEHQFNTRSITDRKGVAYYLDFDKRSHKTIITAKDEMIDWNKVKARWQQGRGSIRIYVKNGNF